MRGSDNVSKDVCIFWVFSSAVFALLMPIWLELCKLIYLKKDQNTIMRAADVFERRPK